MPHSGHPSCRANSLDSIGWRHDGDDALNRDGTEAPVEFHIVVDAIQAVIVFDWY